MANTGYKAWANLEEYFTDTNEATGRIKPNVSGDPDYVAPVYDEGTCPVQDTTPPSIGSLIVTGSDRNSVSLSWGAPSDASGIDRQEVWHNVGGSGQYNLKATLSGTATSYTANLLLTNNTHFFYVRAYDTEGNYIDTNTVNVFISSPDEISLSNTFLYFPSNGGTQTITVTADSAWTRFGSGAGVVPSSGTSGSTSVDITMLSNFNSTLTTTYIDFALDNNDDVVTLRIDQEGNSGGGLEPY